MPADANATSEKRKVRKVLLKFLIPRSQQRRFLIQFTFITVLGWIVGGIASIGTEKILLQKLASFTTLVKFLSSTIFALIFAAHQAIALRPYLSAWWLWILATSMGWLIANSVSVAWINNISSLATSLNKSLSLEEMIFWAALSTICYILSGIWLGFCQWLVLRRYTFEAWWWNFLPSIANFLISILFWLLYLIKYLLPQVNHTQIFLYLFEQVSTAMILGAIPAIGLVNSRYQSLDFSHKG